MQHSQSVRRGRAREVPFGVRALESGIEVEGVWISGTNTPAGSTPGTPTFRANANSAHGEPSPERASSASTMSHLEMSQSTRGYPTVMIASDSNSQDPSPFPDRRVSSDSKQQPPPISDRLPHKRPSYKPRQSSQLRYSNSMKSEDPESLAAREGNYRMPHGKGKMRQGKNHIVVLPTAICLRFNIESESEYEEHDRSVSEGSGSSSGGHHETSYQPSRSQRPSNEFPHSAYPKPPRISRQATYELTDIDTPGSSEYGTHIDEQDHLHVRNRHHAMTRTGQHGSTNETKNPAPEGKDPFATPSRRPSDNGALVFHIDDDSTEYPMRTHDGATDQPSNTEPLVPVDASRQLGRSQIVRKVNSGFQILAPGTLDAPIQDNATRKEDVPRNKRHSRKLQKRSRANSYSIEEP